MSKFDRGHGPLMKELANARPHMLYRLAKVFNLW